MPYFDFYNNLFKNIGLICKNVFFIDLLSLKSFFFFFSGK